MDDYRYHSTDIQSYFPRRDQVHQDITTQCQGDTAKPSSHPSTSSRNIVHGLHQRQLSSRSQLVKTAQRLGKHRLVDNVIATHAPACHVSSIAFDVLDTIFAVSYSQENIDIHELLPLLLHHNSTRSTNDHYHYHHYYPTADTLRLRLHTRQRKHSVSKFSPLSSNLLACGFRNCHTVWLLDLETCSETEPTQLLGKNENLAIGCQDMCFGNPTSRFHTSLACACSDGLGRIYDIRTKQVCNAANVVLRGQVAQRYQASAILLDDYDAWIGYHSGDIAQFDLRMIQAAYTTPIRLWNAQNMPFENKEMLGNATNKFCVAIDDILKDPFFPSVVIAKNRDGIVMGIDTHQNKAAFLQDNPICQKMQKPGIERTKRPRIYGIEENIFSQDTLFAQNNVESQDENELLSLALRAKRAHRLQCVPYCERSGACIIFPDPFSANLRCIDLVECMKRNYDSSVRQIQIEGDSLPCAVAIHKPTNHLIIGLMNGKTVVS